MCELLAMSCRYPARLTGSLAALISHSRSPSHNRDGWGVAYFQERDLALYRDTSPADISAQVRLLDSTGPATTLALAYIRHATQGKKTLANTAPFCRELRGRMHAFAHNGNLTYASSLPPDTHIGFQPVGETDSETAFCQLLNRLHDLAQPTDALPALQARLDCVANMATALRKLGPASFLYADSETLFAHADRRLQPLTGKVSAPALFKLECQTSSTCSTDPDSIPAGESQQVVLLASVPLSERHWQPMREGEVIAVQGGTIVASILL